jgi:hypothetical protein
MKKNLSEIIGTDTDDFVFVGKGIGKARMMKGDDYVDFHANQDARIDGGNGEDTFHFVHGLNQEVQYNTVSDRTVIKLYEAGELVQKIVLFDFEVIIPEIV